MRRGRASDQIIVFEALVLNPIATDSIRIVGWRKRLAFVFWVFLLLFFLKKEL